VISRYSRNGRPIRPQTFNNTYTRSTNGKQAKEPRHISGHCFVIGNCFQIKLSSYLEDNADRYRLSFSSKVLSRRTASLQCAVEMKTIFGSLAVVKTSHICAHVGLLNTSVYPIHQAKKTMSTFFAQAPT